MLIVQGTFRVDPEDRDSFVAQSAENMLTARAEKGCLEFVMAADPVDAGRVILSERWESMDDLNEHTRALNRRRREASERGDAPRPGVVSREIAIYEIASVQPMT